MPRNRATKAELTIKEGKFTTELLKSGNAAKAARKAGYSPDHAKQIGHQLKNKPHIKEKLQTAAEKLGITPEYVLNNFKDISDFNKEKITKYVGQGADVEEVREMRDAAISLKANEMLGKHLKLFTDKIEIEAKIESENRTPEAELELARQLVAILSDPTLKK